MTRACIFGLILLGAVERTPGQVLTVNASGVTSLVQQRVVAARTSWQRHEGAGFESVLSVVNGKPTFVLNVPAAATPLDVTRRRIAILSALDFLLADDTFDQARISICEFNPRRLSEQTVTDVDINRLKFRAVMAAVTVTQTARDGIVKARANDALLTQIFAQLGIQ